MPEPHFGRADGTRTRDTRFRKPLLYQLSYGPKKAPGGSYREVTIVTGLQWISVDPCLVLGARSP